MTPGSLAVHVRNHRPDGKKTQEAIQLARVRGTIALGITIIFIVIEIRF